jgi:hypothetical protein
MINDTLQPMFDLLLSRVPGKTLAVLPAAGSDVEFAIDESIPVYNQRFCSQEVTRLDSSADHRRVLREAFEKAKNIVFIVSPFMTWRAIEADNVDILIAKAVKRGVKVVIVTDSGLNKDYRGDWKYSFISAKKRLEDAGAFVKIVSPVHNKTLCVDRAMISEGSYNWLSAVRTAGSPHKRLERSIMYCGKGVSKMIKDAIREVGGVDQCNGGGIKMKGVKAQKVADGDRYFHMTRRFPVLLAVNIVFSLLIGKLSQDLWMFGVVFFVFAGLIILGNYFFWNNRLNTLLKSGKVTEDEARGIMKSSDKGGGEQESDPFLDADNCGMPGNIFHHD